MRRRRFIALLGSAALAWQPAARAQQSQMPVVGFLSAGAPEAYATRVAALRQGLNESGFTEGRNITIEYRWSHGENDRFPVLAADLVNRKVAVIITSGSTLAATAAKTVTSAIPIVFALGSDPVKAGLVESLRRPGVNATGVTFLVNALVAKQFEVMAELLGGNGTVGFLVNPTNANADTDTREGQAAAQTLGMKIVVETASDETAIHSAMQAFAAIRARAIVVAPDALFLIHSHSIVGFALGHGLATIMGVRDFVANGGLMSYGTDQREAYRQVGIYAARILKGERPADLPVQQTTKFELVINSNTAKALGLAIPPSLLARADEIIE